MALPISIGECLDLVDQGVKLYNKIRHDVPELVAETAERIESLQLYLRRLEAFLRSGNVLVSLHIAEKNGLENILQKMKGEVSKVIKILEKWRDNKAPGGFEFRFKIISQALFALGSSPKELEDLGKKLDQRQDEIRDWMALLLLHGQNQMLNAQLKPGRSPSPSSHPGYNIMFIDIDNIGRSVVAEAYGLLYREWTRRTGGKWKANLVHSAGLNVKARSNTTQLQQDLGMDMFQGNKPPLETALNTLFTNLPFNDKTKDDIHKRLQQRRSRGLTDDLFRTYDFILVFNRYNLASLENLRDALVQKQGKPVPPGKGKLILLGEYGTTGYKEILKARKGPDGRESSENWSVTNDNIKTSFNNFLRKELGWVQPS